MRVKNTSIPVFISLLAFAACGGGGGGSDAANRTPSATLSSLAADRTSAPADGATEVLLTAVVRDTAGAALAGREVRFDAVGAGVTIQPAAVVALNGGLATARLTANVPGNVTVSATVGSGANAVRLDQTLTITFVAPTAPVVTGLARYLDVDGDAVAGQGDQVIVPFSTDVVVSGASATDFSLPVQDDEFGVGASVAAGPAGNEVTITLGVGPKLRTRGQFATGLTNANEPSGIDVGAGSGIVSAVGGVLAAPGTPIDIAPLPVMAATIAVAGEHVAIGDVDGNGIPDVLVAGNGALRPLVNNGGALTETGTVTGQVANDLAVANLNRISAAEALTAEATGVQVWNNSAAGGATPNYSQAQLVAIGETRCVKAADFDRDGFPDIVAGTTSSVVVALHQRNLGNDFVVDQTVGVGGTVFDLQVVDIDRDGDLDVIVALGANGIRVLRNDGAQLQPADQIAAVDAFSLAVGDVDGDGRIDIVVGGSVVTIVGNQPQAFVPTELTIAATKVALVDLDQDAYADLVAQTASGIEYLLNDRTGNFLSLGVTAQTGGVDLAFADLDNDGDDEIVAVDAVDTRSFAGSLGGTFGTTQLAGTQDLGTAAVGKQVLGDLDGDGELDRIVATANGAQVWFGDGAGGFTVATTFGGATPTAIALGDMDGDLDLDGVLGFDGTNEIYVNDGLGVFTFGADFAPASMTRSFGLTDFDQDGDLDVFVGNDGTNQLFLNDGALALTENTAAFLGLLSQATGNETIAVLVFDFDREGDEDIILINGGDITSPQDAYVLRRSGNGYSLLFTLNAQLLATAAAIGDVDDDGRDDLAIAQLSPAGNASIKWYRGLATGISNLPTNVATNGQYFSRSLIVADITGDGRNDLVVGDVSVSNQPLAVLRQLQNGDFEVFQELPTTRLEQIAAGDFDRDGDVDLVTVETTGPSRVLTNR